MTGMGYSLELPEIDAVVVGDGDKRGSGSGQQSHARGTRGISSHSSSHCESCMRLVHSTLSKHLGTLSHQRRDTQE
jgi:hypothetical protein